MSEPHPLAIVSPGRTSSGGSAFVTNLAESIHRISGLSVPLGYMPVAGSARLPDEVINAKSVVFLGSRVSRQVRNRRIFWPLNVAPLDRTVAAMSYSTLRNKFRNHALRHRLGQSVAASHALAFGSHYARTLYTSQFAKGGVLPYTVIPGGTSSLPLEALGGPSTESDRSLVLCVSHLYPYKGVLQFVKAIAALGADLPVSVDFRIAGAAPDSVYAEAVARTIGEAGLEARIAVAEAKPAEMTALYRDASLCVFPSLCENAGSFALFDGFHAGRATLCSDRSSMPEMVRGAADMFDPYDAGMLGRLIVDTLASPRRLDDLENRARHWSATAPTWDDRARQLLEFIRHLDARDDS